MHSPLSDSSAHSPGCVTLCLILWAATPHFFTVSNLLNVLEQTAINAVVAVGMTFVIISGGIDLSVGSVLALSGIALGSALRRRPVAGGDRARAGRRARVRPRQRRPHHLRPPAAVHRHARHDERGARAAHC